jgi:ketosteroid isomerase-like protein
VLIVLVTVSASTPPAVAGDGDARDARAAELRATEVAFAATMANRDPEAFAGFLADETVFYAGDIELRGRDSVAAAWTAFFNEPDAPFSWAPEVVTVLDSGGLGLTSGPVLDPKGNRIGTFNSVWRAKPDGGWEIVFDRGCPPCGG